MFTFHFLDFLFANLIWLMLLKFVCVCLLVLCRELTALISKVKASLSAFSLNNFSSLCSKLFSCLRLVGFCSHSNDNATVSSIFIKNFSFFPLFLLEMIWVTWVKIIVWIMLKLNMCSSISFCFYCIQWFLVIMLLSFGQILSCLLRKSEFKVSIFEVQNPLFIYRLYLTIFMAKLSFMFRVKLPSICSKTDISLIWSSWSFRIRNWFYIMWSCIWCYKLTLIIPEDQIRISLFKRLCPSSLGSIICFIVASCEIS